MPTNATDSKPLRTAYVPDNGMPGTPARSTQGSQGRLSAVAYAHEPPQEDSALVDEAREESSKRSKASASCDRVLVSDNGKFIWYFFVILMPLALLQVMGKALAKGFRRSSTSTAVSSQISAAGAPAAPSTSRLMALPDEILLDIFHMVVPKPLTHTHAILRSGAGHYLPERPWLNSSHHWYDVDSLVSRRYYAFSRQALFHVYTHELLVEYSKGSTDVRPGVMLLHRRRFDVKHTHDIRRLKLSILAPERADFVLAVEKLQEQLEEFPGLCQADIFVETRALRANVHDVEHTLWNVIGVWREAMEKRPRIRMQIAMTLLCRDQPDTGSAHWANPLDFGGVILDNRSLDQEAESTRNAELPAVDDCGVLNSIVAWSLELLWRYGTALTKTFGLCTAPIASPTGPFATQTTVLMGLPEELLLQILLFAVPDKLAGPLETAGQFAKSDLLRATYREYHASTAVSGRYHDLARDAFFSIYMHEIWVLYTVRKRKVHEGVQVHHDHRSEIERLKLRLCSSKFFGLVPATEEVRLWLDMFPGLREVQVFVGTLEHKSPVRKLGPQIWACLMDWQRHSKVERSSRVKIKLVFKCNDRWWVWDESGEARNVKIRYRGVASPLSR
ncbi:hypothetical protein LTR17_000711 [Elasticomyces elasticus]|nr:hypothetical protein LTR17_000711 [Elasticomyces elasticus]